jgi:hypothetical protein
MPINRTISELISGLQGVNYMDSQCMGINQPFATGPSLLL